MLAQATSCHKQAVDVASYRAVGLLRNRTLFDEGGVNAVTLNLSNVARGLGQKPHLTFVGVCALVAAIGCGDDGSAASPVGAAGTAATAGTATGAAGSMGVAGSTTGAAGAA